MPLRTDWHLGKPASWKGIQECAENDDTREMQQRLANATQPDASNSVYEREELLKAAGRCGALHLSLIAALTRAAEEDGAYEIDTFLNFDTCHCFVCWWRERNGAT